MALYRFLFAPVLLAVAVLAGSPSDAPGPTPASRPLLDSRADAVDPSGAPAALHVGLDRASGPRPVRAR